MAHDTQRSEASKAGIASSPSSIPSAVNRGAPLMCRCGPPGKQLAAAVQHRKGTQRRGAGTHQRLCHPGARLPQPIVFMLDRRAHHSEVGSAAVTTLAEAAGGSRKRMKVFDMRPLVLTVLGHAGTLSLQAPSRHDCDVCLFAGVFGIEARRVH